MADEERGAKWWIRYVIVPLIGGGGIIAVVVARMAQPTIPRSADTGSEVVQPLRNEPKIPPSMNPTPPVKPAQRHLLSPLSANPVAPAPGGQPEYVTIQHSRYLPPDALLVDGRKPSDGVIVDSVDGSPVTTLKLLPGQHRLSTNLAGKTCFVVFSVPSSGPVPFPCEVPFEGGHDDN